MANSNRGHIAYRLWYISRIKVCHFAHIIMIVNFLWNAMRYERNLALYIAEKYISLYITEH